MWGLCVCIYVHKLWSYLGLTSSRAWSFCAFSCVGNLIPSQIFFSFSGEAKWFSHPVVGYDKPSLFSFLEYVKLLCFSTGLGTFVSMFFLSSLSLFLHQFKKENFTMLWSTCGSFGDGSTRTLFLWCSCIAICTSIHIPRCENINIGRCILGALILFFPWSNTMEI